MLSTPPNRHSRIQDLISPSYLLWWLESQQLYCNSGKNGNANFPRLILNIQALLRNSRLHLPVVTLPVMSTSAELHLNCLHKGFSHSWDRTIQHANQANGEKTLEQITPHRLSSFSLKACCGLIVDRRMIWKINRITHLSTLGTYRCPHMTWYENIDNQN